MKLTVHEYSPKSPDLVMMWVNDRMDGCLECVPRSLASKILEWQHGSLDTAAELLWTRDYPDGGSMYKTYESTPHHDKELYRREVLSLTEATI